MKCQRTKRGRKLIQVRVLIGDTTTNANEVSVMDTNAIVTAMSTIPTSATCIDKKDCSKTTAKSAAKALRKLVENKKKDAVAAPLQAKLAIMSQKREKNSRDKTIVRNAAEAFNRSIFIELELEKEKNPYHSI
jgi:phage I-like protein